MKPKMRFSLKAGERIFINGAVLTVSSKVTLSLLNDARFLLESHVLQVHEATTPMRQLYFVIQAILIDPARAEKAMDAFRDLHASMMITCTVDEVRDGLRAVAELVERGRTFEALKIIRTLFEVDDEVPARSVASAHAAA